MTNDNNHQDKIIWTKHRRKKVTARNSGINNKNNKTQNDATYVNSGTNEKSGRSKRATTTAGTPIFVETAVFVDKDLYHHMRNNYPVDTERELVRFVLAMINAVSLFILFLLFLSLTFHSLALLCWSIPLEKESTPGV